MENDYLERIEKLHEDFAKLLIKSEERIDRTNEMICNCVSLVGKITEEYTKQLDKVQKSRDEAVQQNSELIKIVQKYEDQIEIHNQKYDKLLEKFLNIGRSENNINVK